MRQLLRLSLHNRREEERRGILRTFLQNLTRETSCLQTPGTLQTFADDVVNHHTPELMLIGDILVSSVAVNANQAGEYLR